MSQAEDLLDEMVEEVMSGGLGPKEEHITIGRDRIIVVPESLKKIAVQYDHNIETVTFECPRYWDDYDLSQMRIYINYMRPDGKKGSCLAENVNGEGMLGAFDAKVLFDWKISRNVTQVKGNIKFLVCIKKVDDAGNEENHWNSELNDEMYVSEGLECEEVTVESYPDIITQLLERMDKAEDVLDMTWVNATDDAIENLDSKKVDRSGDEIDGTLQVNENVMLPNADTNSRHVTVVDSYSLRKTANADVTGVSVANGIATGVLRIDGKSVSTKNLFDIPNITSEISSARSISCVLNKNVVISVGSCATVSASRWRFRFTYKDNTALYAMDDQLASAGYLTFSASDENPIVSISYTGESITEGAYTNIQIEYGDEPTTYAPYFSGLKSANIDSIKSIGENLINLPDVELTPNMSSVGVSLDLSGELFLSCRIDYTDIGNAGTGLVWFIVDGEKKYTSMAGCGYPESGGLFTFKVKGEHITEFRVVNYGGVVGCLSEIMLNYGNKPLPYKKYVESTYQLPETIELGKFDYILPQTGEIVRLAVEETLDVTDKTFAASADSWQKEGCFSGHIVNILSKTATSEEGKRGLISTLKTGNWEWTQDIDNNDNVGFVGHRGNQLFYFRLNNDSLGVKQEDSVETKLAAAKQWFIDHPTTVRYADYALTYPECAEKMDGIPTKYIAYSNGSESINQGVTDNSMYGATPTITQEYTVLTNAKAAATQEFVYSSVADGLEDKLDKNVYIAEHEKLNLRKSPLYVHNFIAMFYPVGSDVNNMEIRFSMVNYRPESYYRDSIVTTYKDLSSSMQTVIRDEFIDAMKQFVKDMHASAGTYGFLPAKCGSEVGLFSYNSADEFITFTYVVGDSTKSYATAPLITPEILAVLHPCAFCIQSYSCEPVAGSENYFN